MRTVILLAAAVMLAACAGEPRVDSSTTDVVTVKYFEGNAGAAESKARDECNRYGKRARLRNTTGQGTGDRMAIYDCII
jgi:ABC-type glycerol-3-phosphate transport system substrate-binding protein